MFPFREEAKSIPEDMDKRRVFSSTIPKQHGAWSILISCYILGIFVGGSIGPNGIILLVSLMFGYLARHTWNAYQRTKRGSERRKEVLMWAVVDSLIVLGTGGYLVTIGGLWNLLGLGAIALFLGALTLLLSQRGMEFTAGGEVMGILGLCLAAPAAEYVATGSASMRTVGLYILSLLFFCGSVYHVRYLVRSKKASQGILSQRMKHGWMSIFYHILALAVVVYLSAVISVLPSLAPVALVPVTIKALYVVAHRYETPLQVRQIGYREVAHTIIFVVLAGLAFYLG